MFYLLGFKECIKNISKLSKKYHGDDLKTLEQLKIAFGLFLNEFQPNVIHKPFSKQLVSKKETVENLIKLYNAQSIVNDKNQDSMIEEIYESDILLDKIRITNDAINVFTQKHPILHTLFDLVIHSIFFANSKLSGGGTVSSGIGVLWLNNRPHWSQQDLIELLIHEMTHTLVFIDEVAHVHITDYRIVADEENFALSAILKRRRPVDKVYHSILVSIEVIESRLDFLEEPCSPKVHPKTQQLFQQTQDSLESLFSVKQFGKIFSPRGQELMLLCEKRLQELKPRVAMICEKQDCQQSPVVLSRCHSNEFATT